MKKLIDILTFRCLVTPVLLQVLFWSGIAGNLYGSWWLYTHDNWAWVMSLVFGTLMIRIVFESLMVKYKTYEAIMTIRDRLEVPNKYKKNSDR